jgi:hypothetical protein
MTQVNVKLSQMREFVPLFRLNVFSFLKDIGIEYVGTRICVMLCENLQRVLIFSSDTNVSSCVKPGMHVCVCVCVCTCVCVHVRVRC